MAAALVQASTAVSSRPGAVIERILRAGRLLVPDLTGSLQQTRPDLLAMIGDVWRAV